MCLPCRYLLNLQTVYVKKHNLMVSIDVVEGGVCLLLTFLIH